MSRGGARAAVTLVTVLLGKKITAEQQIDVESGEMKRSYALSSHGAFDGAQDGKFLTIKRIHRGPDRVRNSHTVSLGDKPIIILSTDVLSKTEHDFTSRSLAATFSILRFPSRLCCHLRVASDNSVIFKKRHLDTDRRR